jgi:hypothetical protein
VEIGANGLRQWLLLVAVLQATTIQANMSAGFAHFSFFISFLFNYSHAFADAHCFLAANHTRV